MPTGTGERDPARDAIDVAVALGAASLVTLALSVSDWADWVIEINETSPSGASANIVGRQLEMIALGALVAGSCLGALLVRLRPGRAGGSAAAVGALTAVLGGVMVALHWQRGWYFHLEHTGPLATLVLAGLHVVALWAAAARDRPA